MAVKYAFDGGNDSRLFNFPLHQKDAQIVGELLEKLRKKNGGTLTAEVVLKEARKKSSPLHKYFEWDESRAAQQYNLSQARGLIRSISIVQIDGTQTRASAFVNLTQKQGVGYDNVVEVMSDEEKRTLLLDKALREARAWVKRYEHLIELSSVLRAIDRVEELIR